MASNDSLPAGKALLDAAITLQKIGDHKEAVRLVKKILKRDSTEIEAAILAGLIYQDLGNIEDAEKYFRMALAINPKYPNALKSWGLFLLSQQRKSEALEIFLQYLELIKWDDEEILDKVVGLATELGGEEKGREILKEAWEHSLNPSIGNRYAVQLRLSNRVKEALIILQILAKASPEPAILNQLAIALVLDQQNENAIRIYKQAIDREWELISKVELDLEHNRELYLIGTESFESNNSDLQSSRDDSFYLLVILYCNLSQCYLASGEKKDALEAVQEADQYVDSWGDGTEDGWGMLESTSFYIMQTKVNALMGLEQYKEADQTIREYLEHNKPDGKEVISLYTLHAQVFEKAQQKTEEEDLLKHALEKFPLEAAFHFQLADLLTELGKLDEAVEVLENAFKALPELDPVLNETRNYKYWEYRLKLAILLHRIGRGETAWEKVSGYLEHKSYDSYYLIRIPLFWDLLIEDSPEHLPDVLLIEQLFSKFPEHLAVIWLMSTLHFSRNDLQASVAVLENTPKSQTADDSLRLALLNNLGYGYLLQGKLELAQKTLEQALNIDNAETLFLENAGIWEFLGVVLFFDGNFLTTNQLWGREPSIDPTGFPSLSIIAVLYNLMALDLAKGDADQATSHLVDILTKYAKDEIDWEQNYLSLLSLARSRNDHKTAQYAWKMKLRKELFITEEQLKIALPGVYAWLFPEDEGKQAG